jgi:tripeptide aminopeptidase
MLQQFMEMVQIDSESGNEARFLEYLHDEVTAVGGKAAFDNYGNLIATFEAKGCEGVGPILLSCHGDTVKPGIGIEPVLADGVIRVRPPIEFAVSRQEEVGLLGVKAMDFSRLTACRGFLMDNDTLDTIVIGGPTYFAIDVAVGGRSAHAGMEPEKGINAIQAAAQGISALQLGRIDHETTANVGVISGGIIRNGVPDACSFLAECRSADHDKAVALSEEMKSTLQREIEAAGATVDIQIDEMCRAVQISEDAWSVRIAKEALATVDIDAEAVFMTGFTDASIYNNRGIEMAVVGIGAQNEHSTDECIEVADMEKAVKMLVEIFRLVADEG